jgi:hypothetical protein
VVATAIQLFVACSPRDRDYVSRVIEALPLHHVTLWWDVRDAHPGARLDKELYQAFWHSQGILAFDSPNSREEGWPKYLGRYMEKYAPYRTYWIQLDGAQALDGRYVGEDELRRQRPNGPTMFEPGDYQSQVGMEIDHRFSTRTNLQPLGVAFLQDYPALCSFFDRLQELALAAAKTPWRIGTKEAVFISYRRSDSADVAKALYRRLADRLGYHNVFMDVHDQPAAGRDVREYLRSMMQRSFAVVVLVGPRWLSGGERGRGVLDPGDWVRLELEAVFESAKTAMPVLVGAAERPDAAQLPASLERFPHLQRLRFSDPPLESEYQSVVDAVARVVPYEVAARPDPAAPPADIPLEIDRGTARLLRWRWCARAHGVIALAAAAVMPFAPYGFAMLVVSLLSPLASMWLLLSSLQACWIGSFHHVTSRVHHFVYWGGLSASLAAIAAPWIAVAMWKTWRGGDVPLAVLAAVAAVQGCLALYQARALTRGAAADRVNLVTFRTAEETIALHQSEEAS